MRNFVPRCHALSPVRSYVRTSPNDMLQPGVAYTRLPDHCHSREASPVPVCYRAYHPGPLVAPQVLPCARASSVGGSSRNVYGGSSRHGRAELEQQSINVPSHHTALEVHVENLSTPSVHSKRSHSSTSTEASTTDAYPKSPSLCDTLIARVCQGENDPEEDYILSPFGRSCCKELAHAPASGGFFSAIEDLPSESASCSNIDEVGSMVCPISCSVVAKPAPRVFQLARLDSEANHEDYILGPLAEKNDSRSAKRDVHCQHSITRTEKNYTDGNLAPVPVSLEQALQRLRESLAEPSAVEYSTAER